MRNDPPMGANYGIWPQILHQVVDTKTQGRSITGMTLCALLNIKHFDQRILKPMTAGGCHKKQPAFFADPNMPRLSGPNTTPHS